MTEKEIMSADIGLMSEDELDELIGAALKVIKRHQNDRDSANTLRQRLSDKIQGVRQILQSARAERRDR